MALRTLGLVFALFFMISCENDVELEEKPPATVTTQQEFDLIREKVDPAHRQAIYEKAKNLRAEKKQLDKEIETFNLQLAEVKSATVDPESIEGIAERLSSLREQKELLERGVKELDQQLDEISEAAREVATLKGK